jgi:serine/threonine-protein kinase
MAMKKISVTGGIPITLCAAENPLGTSWGPDGILFGQGARGIWRVSPDGGEPEVLVAVESTQAAHGPQILPGGRHVLFTLRSGTEWDEADLVVQALDTGERKTLLRGGSDGRFVSSGQLVYANGTTLFAVPFDPTTLESRGAPAPVVEGVLRSTLGATGDAHFSVSANGALAYIPGRGDERASFVLVDRNGRSESVVEERGYLGNPRFSPDGSKIAGLLTDGGRRDAWILDLARGTFARLDEGNLGVGLAWSPDGEWVALSSERSGTGLDLLRRRTDFSGAAEPLIARAHNQHPEAWSPDGEWLVYREIESYRGRLGALRLGEGGGETLPVSPLGEWSASFSPDGRFLAYQSDESGRPEIYVRPFPGPGPRWPISTHGGWYPVWSSDGTEIFYEQENAMMAVAVKTSPELIASTPVRLFEGFISGGFVRDWDVSPDGKRFAVNQRSELPAEIHVVLNWHQELLEKVPVR